MMALLWKLWMNFSDFFNFSFLSLMIFNFDRKEIDAEIKKLSQELLDLFEENKQLEEKVKEILKQNL